MNMSNNNVNVSSSSSSSSLTRISTGGGGSTTTQACAACKYQRRKCAPDCMLAPYFPPDRQRQFLNAHKLFGVSNITKIIKNLEPPEKDEAMKTIIFQSDVRANDPVGGCYRIIRELQRQIEFTKAELELVLHHLAICRAQTQLQIQESDDTVLSYNDIVNVGSGTDDLSSFGTIQYMQEQDHHYVNVEGHLGDHNQVHAWTMQDPNMVSSAGCLQAKQLHQEQPQQELLVQENNHNFVHQSCDQDVKPQLVEIPYERHEIKFENGQVERRRFVPSTQLLISS